MASMKAAMFGLLLILIASDLSMASMDEIARRMMLSIEDIPHLPEGECFDKGWVCATPFDGPIPYLVNQCCEGMWCNLLYGLGDGETGRCCANPPYYDDCIP